MGGKGFGDFFVMALPYIMAVGLVIGLIMRSLVFYTVRRHEWFVREFEKRVNLYIESEVPGNRMSHSFYVQAKRLLEKTYYEAFEIRDRMQRRKTDKVMSLWDRIFMVRQGCAWLVKDLLKQVRLVKWTNEPPRLITMTKATFHQNPYFNKAIGVFPVATTNEIVGILPSMFVVGGILGTFVGIAKGLPELGSMNMQDVENSRLIMERFLHEVSFAMQSSIFGITCSILMNIFNTWFSPERLYVSMNDRFENSLDLLWHRSSNNEISDESSNPTIQRDAAELLAEEAINLEVQKNPRGRNFDEPKKNQAS